MNADFQDFKHTELTDKVLKIFYNVYNKLGYGFLEKIYERAMVIELQKDRIPAVSQTPIKVYYENEVIGEYFADLLVADKIIVEIKATKTLVFTPSSNWAAATNNYQIVITTGVKDIAGNNLASVFLGHFTSA